MDKEELQHIINDEYPKWIKVKRYEEPSTKNPMVDWKSEYKRLHEHHTKETEFLIDKCKQLAEQLNNQ